MSGILSNQRRVGVPERESQPDLKKRPICKVLAARSKEVAKRQQELLIKQAHMTSKVVHQGPPRPKSAGAAAAAATTTQV